MRNCLDAHLGQIVCEKDGVVDWCIVLLEIPLALFEECWPLQVESLPELPYNLNIVTLTLTLWPINSGLLTSLLPPTPLIIPHRLRAFLESLMPLKNWCSIHARCSKSSLKHSIRFCGIFPSLKQIFIAYRSSKVSSRSDCICEIPQLWQSGFSRVYSNCCCSCSFEAEIIKIGQSSYKMYSNIIQNFQESTTNLNACTKKVWKLIEGPTYIINVFPSDKLHHIWYGMTASMIYLSFNRYLLCHYREISTGIWVWL